MVRPRVGSPMFYLALLFFIVSLSWSSSSSSSSSSLSSSSSSSSSSPYSSSSTSSSHPRQAFIYVSADSFTLNIVHTSSCRGRMLPVTTTNNDCAIANLLMGTCLNGEARRATFIAQQRAAYNNTLVLDAGNYWTGTPFADVASASFMGQFIASQSYDAMAIGIQDMFEGPSGLQNLISKIGSPAPQYVAANLVVTNEPALSGTTSTGQPYVAPWLLKNVNGRWIGIIGMSDLTLTQQSQAGGITVNTNQTEDQIVRIAMKQIQAQQPDTNIFIVMVPYDTPVGTFISNLNGVQVFIGRQAGGVTPTAAAGTYPQYFTNIVNDQVPLLLSGDYCASVGSFQLTVDSLGKIVSMSGDTHVLTNATASQNVVLNQLTQANALIQAASGNVVSSMNQSIFGEWGNDAWPIGCRFADCQLGRLLNSALLDYCQDCDVAFSNSGELRASINVSAAVNYNVTYGMIQTALPFRDNIVTGTVSGAVLSQVISHSLNLYGGGGFQQMGNIRVSSNFEPSALASLKVIKQVEVYNRKTGQWKPLDGSSTSRYKIVSNDYFMNGGDAFSMFPSSLISPNQYGPDQLATLVAFIRRGAVPEFPPQSSLITCANTTYLVARDPTNNGLFLWPNSVCLQTLVMVNDTTPNCPINFKPGCSIGLTAMNDVEAWPGQPFLLVNGSTDCRCSGLGTCSISAGIASCACSVMSTTGPFAGVTMIDTRSSADCSAVRTMTEVSNGVAYSMYALSAITIAVSVLCSVFYVYFREEKVVRASSPPFLHVVNAGAMMGAIAAIFIVPNSTAATCGLSAWFGHLAFVLTFSALAVKTYRLYRIFLDKKYRVVAMTDTHLFSILGAIIALEVLIRILEQTISPQKQDIVLDDTNWSYSYFCTGAYFSIFKFTAIAYKLILVAWAAFLSFEIRNIDSNYNEAKVLFLIIYHMMIFAVIAFVSILFLSTSSITATTVIYCFVINYTLSFTVLALVASKYSVILQERVNPSPTSQYPTQVNASVPAHLQNTGLGLHFQKGAGHRVSDDDLPTGAASFIEKAFAKSKDQAATSATSGLGSSASSSSSAALPNNIDKATLAKTVASVPFHAMLNAYMDMVRTPSSSLAERSRRVRLLTEYLETIDTMRPALENMLKMERDAGFAPIPQNNQKSSISIPASSSSSSSAAAGAASGQLLSGGAEPSSPSVGTMTSSTRGDSMSHIIKRVAGDVQMETIDETEP